MNFQEGVLLRDYTTFAIGGRAQYFVTVETILKLQEVIRYCHTHQLRYFVLGKGSNTLFHDDGFEGVVIHNRIMFLEGEAGKISVGAGYSFSLLGVQTARRGWKGLEFASGIPGSVGGAIYMNAGASGGDAFTFLSEVSYINERGDLEVIPKNQLESSYRFSSFQKKAGAIAAARFHLPYCSTARQTQLSMLGYRKQTQPYQVSSAGCVFRNHEGVSAGALIERCGLKGYSIGGAEVSALHGNFIINRGNATARDVIALANHIREVVRHQTGCWLVMELQVVPYRS